LDPNSDADLHTYMANPEIFDVKDGHVAALQGMFSQYDMSINCSQCLTLGPGLGIEMDEMKIREASAKYVENHPAWRNPVWRGKDGSLREW
jgi:galactonate dehydratase